MAKTQLPTGRPTTSFWTPALAWAATDPLRQLPLTTSLTTTRTQAARRMQRHLYPKRLTRPKTAQIMTETHLQRAAVVVTVTHASLRLSQLTRSTAARWSSEAQSPSLPLFWDSASSVSFFSAAIRLSSSWRRPASCSKASQQTRLKNSDGRGTASI